MLFNLAAYAGLAIGTSLVLDLIINIYQCRPDVVDAPNRITGTPVNKLCDEYDYIVIGGGSAGSVVASRLTEDERIRVLLLEAGGPDTVFSDVPAVWSSQVGSEIDWKFTSIPSTKACLSTGGVCPIPRGKVLGGSSVINAMVYVRGNKQDFDHWESLGNTGWGYDDVLPYFKKSEHVDIKRLKRSRFHGTKGNLNVNYLNSKSRIRENFFAAGREMNVLNRDNDYNGRDQWGIAHTQVTVRNGFRCSANKAFLRPAKNRTNLHIALHSFVTKIDIEPGTNRARGVVFRHDGRDFNIRARREVILSAGTIQSPQLLMLSGIGPAQHLQSLGIPVFEDLPGVGRNLQDHIGFVNLFFVANPNDDGALAYLSKEVLTEKSIRQLVKHNKGPLFSAPSCETTAFINTKYQDPSLNWPDVQCLLASMTDLVGVIEKNGLSVDGYATFPYILRPCSRGWILLNNTDPFQQPLIELNYYDCESDLQRAVEGVKFALELSRTDAMRAINATVVTFPTPPCDNLPSLSDEWIACAARYQTQSIYHYAGTCKMGPSSDSMAVVDNQLRVYGISGLRVIDASIMPTIVSGNTNAAAIMIGEKGAAMIKRSQGRI